MERGGKDCEEDTLQTAFKKLRVDAESLPAAVCVSEALSPRAGSQVCTEMGGARPKLSCPKENWHGCMRKSSRGVVRSQRRRRSKSPILHPPKFTYCSSKMSPPSGQLKHQRLAVDLDTCSPSPLCAPPRREQLLSSSHTPSPVFGAPGYEPLPHASAASPEGSASTHLDGSPRRALSDEESSPETGACAGADPGVEAGSGTGASDFQALCKLHDGDGGAPCPCPHDEGEGSCRCHCPGWQGVEVYSFTGLRDVISECERNLTSPEDASTAPPHRRTQAAGSAAPSTTAVTSSSGSPRSCSEQARAYVDDITIEDLSGYMEYYLYIPKKMSHMAEMMYT
ncbi:oxidative stress-responsive serine-rich protein 1 [Hypomesus transpacificus]|uniref:oxidative stress-responsive serine-rich protein 1 n=1 Tax=Hypomesus transpacificus TaxID=137520 RepID=UPI001F0816CC|nr:oxidative stress-responsive serine-rich protein 1 [Hypomesus transpacificus]XP_046881043.1 oxidative stress-responsive serine-rich protein 1 [Hypomesus transpacificus]